MEIVRFHPKIGKRFVYDKLLWPETHSSCSGCEDYYNVSEADAVINRLTAAASNLLAKHKLGAVTEADVRWMETELKDVKPCMPS